jgi:regulatory protein
VQPPKSLSLKGRALKYLAAREHSRAELQRKLAPHAPDVQTLEQVLDELEQRDFLSAARFVDSVIHRRGSQMGVARIRHELDAKGIAPDVMQSALSDLRQSEYDRARALWQRRFGVCPTDLKERARQMRFLQARGFPAALVGRILREAGSEVHETDESD